MFDAELAAIPVQPPRAGLLAGMRISAAIPRSSLILVIAFVVFFVAFPISIMSTHPRSRLALGARYIAQGRVLSVTDVPGCRDAGAHRIAYAFSADAGNEFRGTSVLCEQSPYYSAQAGDQVQIRYLARDPSANAIVGTNSDNPPPIFLFVIVPLFFLLVFSPLYFPQLREVIRVRRLYKTGVVVQGQVVFVKKRSAGAASGWPGSSTAEVYVTHQLPGGGRAETIVWCGNDWLTNQLSAGTTVHILLPPGKSAGGALLEAFIR